MPYHADSLFGSGPRRPLNADSRRIWLARADAARRSGSITALHVEVGRALLRRLSQDGRCDPSHDTLARDAGCSARTVRRALARLQAAGLLTWQRRLVRSGRRVLQTSNAYRLGVDVPQPLRITQRGSPAGLSAGSAPRSVAEQLAYLAAWQTELASRANRGERANHG